MMKFLERKHWRPCEFYIAGEWNGEPAMKKVFGYAYGGVGITCHEGMKDHWSLTHIGTGHKFFVMKGKLERVMRVGRRIGDAADWRFDTLPSFDNDVSQMLYGIIKKEFEKYRAGKSFFLVAYKDPQNGNQVAASAAGKLNMVAQ